MKIHPRREIVVRAELELSSLVIDWMERSKLTYLEVIGVLNQITAQSVIKYALREERHGPDSDKRADEA